MFTLISGQPRRIGLATASLLLTAGLAGCSFGSLNFTSIDSVTLSAPADGATKLTVRNNVGDVTLMADANATAITAVVERVGKGSTQAEAEKALAALVVDLAGQASGVVAATVTHPKQNSRRGYVTNWVITAPPGVELDVRTDVGELEGEGFIAGAEFRTDVGSITLKEIVGSVIATTDVGDVVVGNTGPLVVKTDVGAVTAVVLGTESYPVDIRTDVGDVRLSIRPGWSGMVKAESDVGNVNLAASATSVREVVSKRNRVEASLGDAASQSRIVIQTDVGAIRITDSAKAEVSASDGENVAQ